MGAKAYAYSINSLAYIEKEEMSFLGVIEVNESGMTSAGLYTTLEGMFRRGGSQILRVDKKEDIPEFFHTALNVIISTPIIRTRIERGLGED